ncbi:MAG: MutS-related protein [Candidatus Dormibacterales bacterium]
MKAHLLHRDRDFDLEAEPPANHEDLAQDLDLATLLEAMAQGDGFLFEISLKVLMASLDEPQEILYRQAVLADCLAEPEVVRQMYALAVAALGDRRGIWGFTSQYPSSILSAAVTLLEASVGRLKELRGLADEHGGKFRSPGMAALFRTLQQELDDEYFETVRGHLRHLRFRNGVVISAQLDRDNSGIDFVLRSGGDVRSPWRERLGIVPRTSYSFTIPPRDEAGSQALMELSGRGINLVANAAAQSADHISSYFSMLRAELGFYVGCLNLRDELAAKGVPTAFPEPAPPVALELSTADLREVGLALRSEGEVVGNDVEGGGLPLIIVTGANSGGKSTFLRSLGVAQLMMQSGMIVAARSYRASCVRGLFTHFIREEDQTMTSGRLDEELSRMSAIADAVGPGCLVLFNESFAATNEREGSEIGRQVVRALLEAGIRVIFVTHHFDLAERFRRQMAGSTLFLRADREPDGRRTYKLRVGDPLSTSFGGDIYRRIGGWLEGEDRAGGEAIS